ncbi:hypothetical protein GCM10009648_05840 [Tsukamurella spumae]
MAAVTAVAVPPTTGAAVAKPPTATTADVEVVAAHPFTVCRARVIDRWWAALGSFRRAALSRASSAARAALSIAADAAVIAEAAIRPAEAATAEKSVR